MRLNIALCRSVAIFALVAILCGTAVCQSQSTDEGLKPTGPPIGLSGLSGPISLPSGQPVARRLLLPARPSLGGWTVVSGKPPEGLEITTNGVLHGTPTLPGKFTFTLTASDENGMLTLPPTAVNITENIAIAWKQFPHVEGDSVVGSVEIKNYLSKPADLTVIVVAVNEINKAFALGYQQYTIRPNSHTQMIPFGATLPFGGYIVHADAVAEIAPKSIYRSRLQTDKRLVLTQR